MAFIASFCPSARRVLRSGIQRSAQRRALHCSASREGPGRQIVLLSGGLDSGVLLHHVYKQYGSNTLPLLIDYGQRGSARETAAANTLITGLGLTDSVQLDMSSVGQTLRARSAERRFVPLTHRNGVLLALAASVAGQENGEAIWLALSADDAGWYPSAGREFVEQMGAAIRVLDERVVVRTPWLGLGKADIVREGMGLGVAFEKTWSCMLDYERHCGRCVQCRARKKAMSEAGVVESEGFYLR